MNTYDLVLNPIFQQQQKTHPLNLLYKSNYKISFHSLYYFYKLEIIIE